MVEDRQKIDLSCKGTGKYSMIPPRPAPTHIAPDSRATNRMCGMVLYSWRTLTCLSDLLLRLLGSVDFTDRDAWDIISTEITTLD